MEALRAGVTISGEQQPPSCYTPLEMALEIIQGADAIAAIEGFACDHPRLAHHIQEFGEAFWPKSIGLRDGRHGASKTYDLSFVNDRSSFATLTATPGKHDAATECRLQVQVRYQGNADLRHFKLKPRSSEAAQGWHSAQLAGDDDCARLLEELRIAL